MKFQYAYILNDEPGTIPGPGALRKEKEEKSRKTYTTRKAKVEWKRDRLTLLVDTHTPG